VWLTDTLDHTVRKCTPEGKVLMTLGTSGKPAKSMSGLPFCRCTHVALHPATGEVFVSDGYGNASVHKYTPDGRLMHSWGEPGNRPGQFNLPHNIATDRDGYVYVADRENSRVQIFSANGKLEDIWTGMARPCGLYIDTRASQMSSASFHRPGGVKTPRSYGTSVINPDVARASVFIRSTAIFKRRCSTTRKATLPTR
jgi:DNA-binding beta-propeller fold protein YncE